MNLIVAMRIVLVIAILFNAFLLFRDIKRKLADPEGKKVWEKQKKFAVYNGITAFACNFIDVFGIGSYATTSVLSKLRGSIDDENIPGTLNVGDTIPVSLEALLFLELVQLDSLTFIGMVGAAVLGSAVGASIVTKWDRQKVRYGMGIGLLIVGIVMICKQAGIGPFGLTGTAIMLRGWKLIVAVLVCFVLGALMNLGIGMYAPCMALVLLLGMNVQAAFPIMFGSCAYLMAFGSTPKFIKESRYDMVATLENAVLGAVAVLIAYYLVKSLDVNILIWLVVCVVFITSGLFLKDAVGKKSINTERWRSMGLGPSTKMTTLHHYRCPVSKRMLQDEETDFIGIIVDGVSENFDDKVFTAERSAELAALMGADGALVSIDGWGNHHVDFVHVIEQLGIRDIPAVGLSYIAQQGRLVCSNSFVDCVVDFNKSESGYESCIVGENNLGEYDALKALALLKNKMNKWEKKTGSSSGEQRRAYLEQKRISVKEVRFGTETKIQGDVLYIDKNIAKNPLCRSGLHNINCKGVIYRHKKGG